MESTNEVYPAVLLDARPAATPEPETFSGPLPSMFELVLRDQRRLDDLLSKEEQLPGSVQRLLGLGVAGMALHGVVVGLAATLLDGAGTFFHRGTPALWMPPSFVLACLGALCICLPSFYFYTQLSGLDASFRLVTAQALRTQATTSVLLLGALPFYAAWALGAGVGVFDVSHRLVVMVGMALPFFVGLWGIRALHRSFGVLAGRLPVTHRRRGNFLRRMVLAWGAVYATVAPVALYRLAEALGEF